MNFMWWGWSPTGGSGVKWSRFLRNTISMSPSPPWAWGPPTAPSWIIWEWKPRKRRSISHLSRWRHGSHLKKSFTAKWKSILQGAGSRFSSPWAVSAGKKHCSMLPWSRTLSLRRKAHWRTRILNFWSPSQTADISRRSWMPPEAPTRRAARSYTQKEPAWSRPSGSWESLSRRRRRWSLS